MDEMCLSIPGRVTAIDETSALRTGRVDFGAAARDVCLVCVPEARVGSYVVAHLGFAVSVVDASEARRTREVDRALQAVLERELRAETDGFGR